MNNKLKKISSILIFFTIAVSLRYYVTEYKPTFLLNVNAYLNILLQGIGPLLGGLIVVKLMKRPNSLTIFSLGFWKTILIVGIPILLFSLVGILNTGKLYFGAPKIVGIIILYALFEEYGWRGYLQSELNDLKKVYKYLIITTLWFIWHLNFQFSIGNLIFFMLLFLGSYGIGLIADKSKSLIMCALFHSFFNLSQTELLNGIDLNYKLIIITISSTVAIMIMQFDKKKMEYITTANNS